MSFNSHEVIYKESGQFDEKWGIQKSWIKSVQVVLS
jgi:hypothetical protein